MTVERVGLTDFLGKHAEQTSSWSVVSQGTHAAVIVDVDRPVGAAAMPYRAHLPTCPVIALVAEHSLSPAFADVIARTEFELELVVNAISAQPHAATVLVQLLRQSLALTAEDALFAESLAYSTLQHGGEFLRWLDNHNHKPGAPDSSPAVLVERDEGQLHLTLNRPSRRNAYSAEMRDALCEALGVALLDSTITQVHLQGSGVAFCAGGDLGEFGEARDAAIAHLSRSTLSAGAMLLQQHEKIHSHVHGACIGAGIELPAFGRRISAAADSVFQLPEVAMGLVPGAGGTVSLPRRIGRQRTAWLALTGQAVNAETALAWGLVDELIA